MRKAQSSKEPYDISALRGGLPEQASPMDLLLFFPIACKHVSVGLVLL